MTDMRPTIVPKSDQLNADDLISGPRTVTITAVSVRPGTEQPVAISFEGDDRKPYKPCKSMCRVMVAMWGPDAKEYAGRSMTLYRDPKVKWAGLEVGGIRISHMSHIERDHVMALTETRSSRKPFTVKPLATKAQPQTEQPHPPAEPDPQATRAAGDASHGMAPRETQEQSRFVGDVQEAMKREWTKESLAEEGGMIAEALKACQAAEEVDSKWAVFEDTIMTMPVAYQNRLSDVRNEVRARYEGRVEDERARELGI